MRGKADFCLPHETHFWPSPGHPRTWIKAALNQGLLAKYVLADRIESISFRCTFDEFVTGRMSA
jgi:hypothetical protein